MEERFCQSCGMPLGATDELLATNADGSKNEEYCKYCMENGAYTMDITMEKMIELCAPHMASENENMTEADAIKMMQEYFPKLKRWQAN